MRLGDRVWTVAVGQPEARQGLALATLLVGGLLTILIGVVGSQSRRRERDALGLIAMRRAERDRAELARLEAEARSRVLAETSTDLICVLEPDGSVRYASPACRDLLGLEPEALLGRAFTDLVHEDDAAGVAAVLGGGEEAAGLDHPPDAPAERAPCGSRRGCASSATPRPAPLVETHATVRDVAERMQSQAALAEAEERFRSAFEEAPIGMALTSPDFRFLRVNRALCQITGYTAQQLEGLPVASITHPTTSRPTGRRAGRCSRASSPATAPSAATCTPRAARCGWRSTRRWCATPTASRSTSSPRCRTSPSAAATRPSCATWPTTTR